jgi:hypothetical protein
MKPHQIALAKATAAWMQIHGETQNYGAAIMRNDIEGAEVIRVRLHDLLDSMLDMNAEAAVATRALLDI